MRAVEKVKIGVAIPQHFLDGPVDIALVRDSVLKAESLGYHSVWVMDKILGNGPTLDPLSLLGYAAALTSKLRLGTAVLVTPMRNPVHLAKILASLDHISAGRLIVGIGLGSRPVLPVEDEPGDARSGGGVESLLKQIRQLHFSHEYPAFGVPYEEGVRRFIEGLKVMKELWTQPLAEYRGEFWQLNGIEMEPKPIQKPHPPILFGGRHPGSLRRAVRHGNGWMGAGPNSTAQFKEQVQLLRRFLEEEGRDPSTFLISKEVYVAVDDNEVRAEKRLREWFGRSWYESPDLASKVCVWGSYSRCIEQLAEIVTTGAQLLLISPIFDRLEHLDSLAQEVIPHIDS